MKTPKRSGESNSGPPVHLYEEKLKSFLAGDTPAADLAPFLKDDTEFRKYVADLAETESRLATLLAQSRYSEAEPMDPPAWAHEQLKGAVQMGLSAKSRSLRSSIFSWKFAFAGSLCALLFMLFTHLNKPSEESLNAQLAQISDLPVDAFIAQVGPPIVVRGASPLLYSPKGLTSQKDPSLLIRDDAHLQELKIQVMVLNQSNTPPSEGYWRRGDVKTLGLLVEPKPNFQAGDLVQIRLLDNQSVVAEEVFKIADSPDSERKSGDRANLESAAKALLEIPPRPGDALTYLASCSAEGQKTDLALRLKYMALMKAGDLQASEGIKVLLQRK